MAEECGENTPSMRERVRMKYGSSAAVLHGDTAVLRGKNGVVLYGCRRILSYDRQRICFAGKEYRICVWGNALVCTSFTAGTVTVEGRIGGVRYCNEQCEHCPEREDGGGRM